MASPNDALFGKEWINGVNILRKPHNRWRCASAYFKRYGWVRHQVQIVHQQYQNLRIPCKAKIPRIILTFTPRSTTASTTSCKRHFH